MSDDIPKIEVDRWAHRVATDSLNQVEPWGSEPKEDNGWISVLEKMPEEGQPVLACNQDGGIWPAMAVWVESDNGNGWVWEEYDSGPLNDGDSYVWEGDRGFAYWMPLPPMLRSQAS